MQASQQSNGHKIFYRASGQQRLTACIILVAIIALFGLLALAATGVIDPSRWLSPCGFKQRYHLPCPTCGWTTSALVFVRGEILQSFYIQPAAAIMCCVLVITAFFAFLMAVFGVYFTFLKRFFNKVKIGYVIVALVVVIIAAWAVTLARALSGG
jgi:hypothetical protein